MLVASSNRQGRGEQAEGAAGGERHRNTASTPHTGVRLTSRCTAGLEGAGQQGRPQMVELEDDRWVSGPRSRWREATDGVLPGDLDAGDARAVQDRVLEAGRPVLAMAMAWDTYAPGPCRCHRRTRGRTAGPLRASRRRARPSPPRSPQSRRPPARQATTATAASPTPPAPTPPAGCTARRWRARDPPRRATRSRPSRRAPAPRPGTAQPAPCPRTAPGSRRARRSTARSPWPWQPSRAYTVTDTTC